MAERALADAQQADARRGLGRSAPAGRAAGGEGLGGRGRRGHALGHRGVLGAGEPRRGARAAAARRRSGRDRQDQPPRAGDHGLDRGPGVRRDAQPMGRGSHTGRVERRQRRGGGGRSRRGRDRVGRGRVDPDSRRQLRPRRAQAPARSHPARPARRALVRAERRGLRDAHRGRHRAAAGRGRGPRGGALLRGGGRLGARDAARGAVDAAGAARAGERPGPARRGAGGRVPAFARPHRRKPRPRLRPGARQRAGRPLPVRYRAGCRAGSTA